MLPPGKEQRDRGLSGAKSGHKEDPFRLHRKMLLFFGISTAGISGADVQDEWAQGTHEV